MENFSLNLQIPEVFLPLLAPRRYKRAKGGRGSGKSHFFATLTVLRTYQSPTRVVCAREVQSAIRESVRQLIIDKINYYGLASAYRILDEEIRGHNGSLIIFKGLQSYNADNVKSLEGYDIAWIEEAQTLSHVSLRMLRPTIRNPGSEMWFSDNPRHKTDAIDEFFRSFPLTEINANTKANDRAIENTSTWRENPFFPEELKKDMEDDYKKNPEMAHHIWGGGYEIIHEGSYFGKDIATAEQEQRINNVTYDRATGVVASWDLGIGDSTAIWLFQRVGLEWHFIDCYENNSQPLDHYVDWIKGHPYHVEEHFLPHDAEAREQQTGKSRLEFLIDRGLACTVLPRHNVEDGIAAVRSILPQCYFDKTRCEEGLDALRMYRSAYNEKNRVFANKPLHDHTSHFADAFRYAAMSGYDPLRRTNWAKPLKRNLHLVA
jgi:phage terminase large subunit